MTSPMIPTDFLISLHTAVKFGGKFKSLKQRSLLVNKLNEYALSIRTMGSVSEGGEFVASAREYIVGDDRGKTWAFTCHKTSEALASCLTRRKLIGADATAARAGKVLAVEPVVEDEPAVLGPVVDEDVRAELRQILKWGPSEFVFVAPSLAARNVLSPYIDLERLDEDRSRRTTEAWDVGSLTHITQVQIAAKGLLCEVGDNAGTSPMSMSFADAEYISQMITDGHIRNAHWFKRKSMTEKALRRATVVNEAKMDPATAALARRMVALMNAEAERLGRPIGFAEYIAIMTEEAA